VYQFGSIVSGSVLTAQYQIKNESRENSCKGRIEKTEENEQTWLRLAIARDGTLSVSESQY
jgi:hypothetical protein